MRHRVTTVEPTRQAEPSAGSATGRLSEAQRPRRRPIAGSGTRFFADDSVSGGVSATADSAGRRGITILTPIGSTWGSLSTARFASKISPAR